MRRGRPRIPEATVRYAAPFVFAFVVAIGACVAHALPGVAQTEPTPPAQAPSPIATPLPGAPDTTTPAPAPPGLPQPLPTVETAPAQAPTQPPIIAEPPSGAVTPGGSQTFRLLAVLGAISVTVADPTIVSATVDQDARTLTVVGKTVGTTVVTVRDQRGLTRDVAIRVAYPAGSIAENAFVRVTGRPASEPFLREQALAAALREATSRPGANVIANVDEINGVNPLAVDDVTTIDVPIIVSGEGYITVQGVTHVRVENFAQPNVAPKSLLVSDFPETLTENGTLFEADVNAQRADRFLYFHYDPRGQVDRRIVLRVQNTSSQPALVQVIAGDGGPDPNEMLVGHVATEKFLVRLAQNEGTVVTVAPKTTATLFEALLPAANVASGLLQLHEIAGAQLHLALVAQNADDPIDGTLGSATLLAGGAPHARGIYAIPDFHFDYSYDADGPDLEIPIGQIPLPNLVQGQTLSGDYGVLQDVTIRMINNDRHNAREIAIYANPRGGRATGTFVIDRVLVQAHAMAPFGHYKIRQYTIPPGSFVRTEIETMPEGGSSYPLRLVVAPDDGSAAPGTGDSPVY